MRMGVAQDFHHIVSLHRREIVGTVVVCGGGEWCVVVVCCGGVRGVGAGSRFHNQ